MNFRYLCFLLFAITALEGCSSIPSGEAFSSLEPAPADKALAYIYRPPIYYGKAITYPILLNEEKIASIGENGFFTMELDAGDYSIRPDTDSIDNIFDFSAENGAVYFLRLKTNRKPAICFCTSLEFELVDEELALAELGTARRETDRVYVQQVAPK